MSVAESFFRSTPLLRWTLIPVLVLFGAGMPFLVPEYTLWRALLTAALSGTALLYAAALLWPRYLWITGRIVAVMVFLFYAAYAISEWFFSDHPFVLGQRKSVASALNSLLGLLIIGIPALLYAIRRRPPEPEPVAVPENEADWDD
jgi:hypothetical protein